MNISNFSWAASPTLRELGEKIWSIARGARPSQPDEVINAWVDEQVRRLFPKLMPEYVKPE